MPSVLTSNVVQGIAFVLFLLALPLISFGTTDGQETLWWIGLALIAVAGVLPPLTRFVPLADDEEDDENENEDAGADAADGDDADPKEETS